METRKKFKELRNQLRSIKLDMLNLLSDIDEKSTIGKLEIRERLLKIYKGLK